MTTNPVKNAYMRMIDKIGSDSGGFCQWNVEKAEEMSEEEWESILWNEIRVLNEDSVSRAKYSIAEKILKELSNEHPHSEFQIHQI